MPIVDVEVVGTVDMPDTRLARALADTLGEVFGSPPGRTWVRLRWLPGDCYAENRSDVADASLPVFVSVLHARPPGGDRRADEVLRVTHAVANVVGRAPERVHVGYAPPAASRQAFGGRLVASGTSA